MAEPNAKNAERQYHDPAGPYILPNDTQEHDRLDIQSEAYVALMHGKPFHAPASNPKRILDIGCGTGAMTVLLARKYPDAEVIGLDISPVPERHHQPENLTYVQGNIMELCKSDDAGFQPGSFDYIFHRLLVFGLTDWPAYVAVVQSLLRPGGWAEMQDLDSVFLDGDGKNLTDGWWFHPRFVEDCKHIGLDVNIGQKLKGYMNQAGSLENVDEIVYKLPLVMTPDMEGEELMAKLMEKNMGASQQALVGRVCSGRRSQEEMDKMCADMIVEFEKLKPGAHARMFVAVGQKVA